MRQDVLATCATVVALAVGVSSAHAQDPSHPVKVMADGRTWTTSNLGVTNKASFCYGDDGGREGAFAVRCVKD